MYSGILKGYNEQWSTIISRDRNTKDVKTNSHNSFWLRPSRPFILCSKYIFIDDTNGADMQLNGAPKDGLRFSV